MAVPAPAATATAFYSTPTHTALIHCAPRALFLSSLNEAQKALLYAGLFLAIPLVSAAVWACHRHSVAAAPTLDEECAPERERVLRLHEEARRARGQTEEEAGVARKATSQRFVGPHFTRVVVIHGLPLGPARNDSTDSTDSGATLPSKRRRLMPRRLLSRTLPLAVLSTIFFLASAALLFLLYLDTNAFIFCPSKPSSTTLSAPQKDPTIFALWLPFAVPSVMFVALAFDVWVNTLLGLILGPPKIEGAAPEATQRKTWHYKPGTLLLVVLGAGVVPILVWYKSRRALLASGRRANRIAGGVHF